MGNVPASFQHKAGPGDVNQIMRRDISVRPLCLGSLFRLPAAFGDAAGVEAVEADADEAAVQDQFQIPQ